MRQCTSYAGLAQFNHLCWCLHDECTSISAACGLPTMHKKAMTREVVQRVEFQLARLHAAKTLVHFICRPGAGAAPVPGLHVKCTSASAACGLPAMHKEAMAREVVQTEELQLARPHAAEAPVHYICRPGAGTCAGATCEVHQRLCYTWPRQLCTEQDKKMSSSAERRASAGEAKCSRGPNELHVQAWRRTITCAGDECTSISAACGLPAMHKEAMTREAMQRVTFQLARPHAAEAPVHYICRPGAGAAPVPGLHVKCTSASAAGSPVTRIVSQLSGQPDGLQDP